MTTLEEIRKKARAKMNGCYVCPDCDGNACSGMRLMSCHRSCGIVQNADCLPSLIVDRIYNACDSRSKKSRVADK